MADQYRDRPFPADDEYSRDQSRIAPQQGESDPLAELARLIGQADPLSGFGDPKKAQQATQSAQYDQYDDDVESAAVDEVPAIRPSWVQNLAASRHAPQEPVYRQEPAYRQEPEYRDQNQGASQEDHYDPRYARAQSDPAYGSHAPQFDHSGYDPVPPAQAYDHQQAAGGDRYDDALYGRPDHVPGRGEFGVPDEHYGDGAYDRPPFEDNYEQEPKPRRGGTMTVVVVLLLAVVGTGAAFAYRTLVGSPRSGEPPVIKADTGPNKVIPPSAIDGSGKQIYDRVGDKSAERVVSREEQPVDVNARTGPRVVFPPLTQNTNPPSAASASTSARPTGAGVGNGTLSGGEEPRKIRTLSIRPDQPDSAAAPAAPARAQPSAQQRAPAPISTASTGTPQANAPVSITPQAQTATAPEPRSRVAAINPAAVTGGGAWVQVSSQKSEADAKSSFKSLQGKYAGILGSRSASIHKAEIAGKGTFYRAMVGPFGTNDEATQFCVNLKSAGGQCVVQRR
jgi:hypothetical protein